MPEQRIAAGATHVFPVGLLNDGLALENRHGVAGAVVYQIDDRPPVSINFNNDNQTIYSVNGRELTVTNNLPNSLYCVY